MTRPIHVITPIVGDPYDPADFAAVAGGIEIVCTAIAEGPSSIESEYDEALAVPKVLQACLAAERAGAGAIVIDCFGDPGLRPAREVVSTPVVGPGMTSMHLAASLAQRFSVIGILESVRPMTETIAEQCGVRHKLVSIRMVDMPVLEVLHEGARLEAALLTQSRLAVETDHADAIVLGCTGMFGMAERLAVALGGAVPVIDPISAAVSEAAQLIRLALAHSKRTFPRPRRL
jgi:allantoin racemase